MSRKDTILVAVLVNLGVLVILFVSSIKHTSNSPIVSKTIKHAPKLTCEKQVVSKKPVDQVDRVLEKFSEKEIKVVAPVAAEVKSSNNELKQIQVKQGDVLEKIAKTYSCSVEELKNLNQLTSSNLQIGQLLFVPKHKTIAKPSPAKDTQMYYTVKVGDNPWLIAKKNHMKVEELLKLNGLDESKAKRLKPGDKLRIR